MVAASFPVWLTVLTEWFSTAIEVRNCFIKFFLLTNHQQAA